MTLSISIPNRRLTIGDRILKFLGRERRAIVPKGVISSAYKENGPYVYLKVVATHEGFWSALLMGSRNQQ